MSIKHRVRPLPIVPRRAALPEAWELPEAAGLVGFRLSAFLFGLLLLEETLNPKR